MNSIAKELLLLLKERGEMEQLPKIVEDLTRELYRSQKVTVVSAQELDPKQLKTLEEAVTRKWGEHELSVTVDPSILSGVVIRFGHEVIDRSGRRGLADLSASLA